MADDPSGTTTLMPNQAAIVWDPEDGFTGKIPAPDDGDAPMPNEIILLVTILMRLQTDQAFVDNCSDWIVQKEKEMLAQEGNED